MTTVFVSHPQSKLAHYFGERASNALRAFAQVRFNPEDRDLSSHEIAELARDCDAIVSYRQTVGDEALFAALPKLQAFVRCAIDIRNIDLAAASRHGVLVTQASAGFIASVSEWIVGAMIDLARGISVSTALYHTGLPVPPAMGRELRGATLGVIGYGQISRYLCTVAQALGMRVVVHDPFAVVAQAGIVQAGFDELLAQSDFVVCLAPATEDTENLMNAAAFAAMRPGAFFINAARGIDEEGARPHRREGGGVHEVLGVFGGRREADHEVRLREQLVEAGLHDARLRHHREGIVHHHAHAERLRHGAEVA